MLDKLISINKELQLVKTIDDIEFLFLNYKIDETLSLDQQINESLKWAYNNDDLDDFFSEHIDSLLWENELVIPIASCYMNVQISRTSFTLYQFESKNKFYYFIDASGDFADSWDESRYTVDKDIHELSSEVFDFESKCHEINSCDGEFDDEELEDAGASIEFEYYIKIK